MSGATVEFQVHFRTGARGRRRLRSGSRPKPPEVPTGRIPRVTRLLALAIRYDRLIREGEIKDYAELARLGGVSRARVTQIMDLLNLAPDLQEEILFLPKGKKGNDTYTERYLRVVVRHAHWTRQRVAWNQRQRVSSAPDADGACTRQDDLPPADRDGEAGGGRGRGQGCQSSSPRRSR